MYSAHSHHLFTQQTLTPALLDFFTYRQTDLSACLHPNAHLLNDMYFSTRERNYSHDTGVQRQVSTLYDFTVVLLILLDR